MSYKTCCSVIDSWEQVRNIENYEEEHAAFFIQMLDKAIGMIGPDIEMLTDILMELGKKHVSYGVLPQFFPSMGRSLIETLEETLGKDAFDVETKNCWTEVYGALSYDMIRAQKL
ncbi:globin-like protein [Nitzschia inconspicua]|uniref:Globin-like protein n=1 Tax=Nitzschia inconspicua TaxID=303405 RepID=A0A9K3LAK3_9STRA|nr:globin-like protein [Nitzschia inconspicua]